jgi:Protein of unknown function (DUF3309)
MVRREACSKTGEAAPIPLGESPLALPTWPYSSGWGYYPSGGLGLVLIILLILVLMDECSDGDAAHEHAQPDSGADDEQSYLPSFEKLLAPSLIAFIAILGPFQPIISSFLSSSSSVATKNFSSSC